jgi:hypothetical protein
MAINTRLVESVLQGAIKGMQQETTKAKFTRDTNEVEFSVKLKGKGAYLVTVKPKG